MLLYKAQNPAYVPFVLVLPNNMAIVLDRSTLIGGYFPTTRPWYGHKDGPKDTDTPWTEGFHPPVDVSNNIGPILHALFEELTKHEDVQE